MLGVDHGMATAVGSVPDQLQEGAFLRFDAWEGIAAGRVRHDPVPPCAFGPVHRLVGALQPRLPGGCGEVLRHPDTDGDSADALEELPAEAFPDAFGQGAGAGEPRIRHEHNEFLAPPAGQGIRETDHRTHPVRHLPEHAVALLMAMGIVDLFEVVDVEHQQGHRMPIAPRPVHLPRDRLLEMPPVPGAGQQIRARKLFQGLEPETQGLLGALALGDIPAHPQGHG